MDRTPLLHEISRTFEGLYKALLVFNDYNLDRKPAPESWSAGQVAEHLIKGMSGIGRMGVKTVKVDRAADEKVAAIKKMFLDFSIKMTSPEFIEPTEEQHNLSGQLAGLKEIEEQHRCIAEDADLSLESQVFELPGFGAFTLYEWVSFNMVHAQRHTQQLHRIHQAI
jgi:DinB family protein